jgi:hypothetical protein
MRTSLQIAVFDGKKSREKLIGKKVKFIGKDITGQLNQGSVYTIKKISAGNYEAFIYLNELPEERLSLSGNGMLTRNTFDIGQFELVKGELNGDKDESKEQN